MSETDPDFVQRFAALGAGLPPEIADPPAPAAPTAAMTVDGVALAPASRLLALARIRDTHRSASRAANDRMHSAREAIEDREARIKRIRQSDNGRGSATGMGEIAVLQAEIDQFSAARATAQAEVEVAGASWRDATILLHNAIRFAREAGAVIPVTLHGEVK